MRYRKKPLEVEAYQWYQNGDHPDDEVGEPALDWIEWADLEPERFGGSGPLPNPDTAPAEAFYKRIEGALVRFFRRPEPEFAGDTVHAMCGRTYHDHGWIDTGRYGHTVCPGDWIVQDALGEHYPVNPEVFAATYEPVEAVVG